MHINYLAQGQSTEAYSSIGACDGAKASASQSLQRVVYAFASPEPPSQTFESLFVNQTLAEVSFPAGMEEWDAASVRDFRKLARLEALGTATVEQLDRLDKLSVLRRIHTSPRTAAEIVNDHRLGLKAEAVLNALKDFYKLRKFYGESEANQSK